MYVFDEKSTYPDKGKVYGIHDGKAFVQRIVQLIVYWHVKTQVLDTSCSQGLLKLVDRSIRRIWRVREFWYRHQDSNAASEYGPIEIISGTDNHARLGIADGGLGEGESGKDRDKCLSNVFYQRLNIGVRRTSHYVTELGSTATMIIAHRHPGDPMGLSPFH
jgi:hypothetical protein